MDTDQILALSTIGFFIVLFLFCFFAYVFQLLGNTRPIQNENDTQTNIGYNEIV